jgi:hypothetical protein
VGGEAPVLLGDERADLVLAVDDHPQRDRLHPAGGDARRHRAPQHRRQPVADDAVHGPARLLGVDERGVEVARRLEGRPDGRLGDLVEGDPVGGVEVEVEDLGDVPGDGLALAVEVRGEPDGVGLLGGLAQRGDVLLRLLGDLVDEPAPTGGPVPSSNSIAKSERGRSRMCP